MKLPFRIEKWELGSGKIGEKLDSLKGLFNRQGFTMIELLVVIAVIGVLAVAVLSSINPIEQINKGRDTRARSDAAQLINAVDRYFAIHEVYPWNFANPDNGYTPGDVDFESGFNFDGSSGDWGWLDVLVGTAEVKQGFINRVADEGKLYIYKNDGPNESMYACFIPSSNAFEQEAASNCADGTTPGVAGGEALDAGNIFCNSGNGGDDWICLP